MAAPQLVTLEETGEARKGGVEGDSSRGLGREECASTGEAATDDGGAGSEMPRFDAGGGNATVSAGDGVLGPRVGAVSGDAGDNSGAGGAEDVFLVIGGGVLGRSRRSR